MHNFSFYVAGPWAHRPQVREEIAKIRAAGWGTCSRWAEPDNPDVDPADPEYQEKMRFQAVRDVEDVVKADGLFYINSKLSEGKATELGISIAMLKPIIVIGERVNNIFLHLSLPNFPTTEEALEWLEGDGMLYLDWVESQQVKHIHRTAQLVHETDELGPDIANLEFPSE